MSWSDKLKAVGQAYVELLDSELSAVRDDLRGTGRRVGGLLLLLVAVAITLFWAVGLLVYSLVEIATLWLPRWGATLTILALLVVVTIVLALVVRGRWRGTELPANTVRRHFDEHVAWWESRVVGGSEADRGALENGEAAPDDREIIP